MWNSLGFEIADHTWFNGDPSCQDFTSLGMLNATLDHELGIFAEKFPSLPAPQTTRTHCIAWSDWASQPKADLAHGIRLNTDYYYFPAEWTLNRPGLFTGSGLPMRFADCNGSLIDVYQATTYAADDATTAQGATDNANTVVPQETKALIDAALGATGYYGAFTVQVHTDFVAHAPARDVLVADAMPRGVPVISELQLLRWLDGRNASSFQNVSYGTDGTLSFSVTQAPGATGLQAMIPAQGLTALTHNGQAMAIQTQTIKGISYAILPDASGDYVAKYPAPGAARVASSFTGSIAGGTGGGGACEDAGDPAPTRRRSRAPTPAAATPAAAPAATPARRAVAPARAGARGRVRHDEAGRGLALGRLRDRERGHASARVQAHLRGDRAPAARRAPRADLPHRDTARSCAGCAWAGTRRAASCACAGTARTRAAATYAPATYRYSVTAVGSAGYQRTARGSAERAHGTLSATYLVSRYSWMPSGPPSRPKPDCLTPPKGAPALETMPWLRPIIPVSRPSMTLKARLMSCV